MEAATVSETSCFIKNLDDRREGGGGKEYAISREICDNLMTPEPSTYISTYRILPTG